MGVGGSVSRWLILMLCCAMILVTSSGWVLSWVVRVSWHCLERVRSVWVLYGIGVDVLQLGLG